MKKRFSKRLSKGTKRENYEKLKIEGMIQCRCGIPKDIEDLLMSRQLRELCDDLRAAKKAAERWMDERGIPHGIFNPPMTDEEFWSARNNESVIRFIRRQEIQNTDPYDYERFD